MSFVEYEIKQEMTCFILLFRQSELCVCPKMGIPKNGSVSTNKSHSRGRWNNDRIDLSLHQSAMCVFSKRKTSGVKECLIVFG